MVPAFQQKRAPTERPASRSTVIAMAKRIALQTRIPSRFAQAHSIAASTSMLLRIVVADSRSTHTHAKIPAQDALSRIRWQCVGRKFRGPIHLQKFGAVMRYSGFVGSMLARNSIPFPVNRARERTSPRGPRGHNAASSFRMRSYRPLGGLSSRTPQSRRSSMSVTTWAGVTRVCVRSNRTAFGIRLHPDRASASR